MAAKKIRSDIRWKKSRDIAGIVIPGTLAQAAGGAAVAAPVATFGAAPDIIGGIGIAVAGICALKTVVDVGKSGDKAKEGTVRAIQECMKRDEALNKVFQDARKLVGDFQKIDFLGPRSMAGSLQRYKNLDSVLGLANQLNAIAGGANTLAGTWFSPGMENAEKALRANSGRMLADGSRCHGPAFRPSRRLKGRRSSSPFSRPVFSAFSGHGGAVR